MKQVFVVLATLGFLGVLFALAHSGRYQAREYNESVRACRYGNTVLVLDTWTGRISCEMIENRNDEKN